MINEGEKKILLGQEDFIVFVSFKKHREKFLSLLKAGVFDLNSGRAEININNSQVQSIFLHSMTYKRDSKESPHLPI